MAEATNENHITSIMKNTPKKKLSTESRLVTTPQQQLIHQSPESPWSSASNTSSSSSCDIAATSASQEWKNDYAKEHQSVVKMYDNEQKLRYESIQLTSAAERKKEEARALDLKAMKLQDRIQSLQASFTEKNDAIKNIADKISSVVAEYAKVVRQEKKPSDHHHLSCSSDGEERGGYKQQTDELFKSRSELQVAATKLEMEIFQMEQRRAKATLESFELKKEVQENLDKSDELSKKADQIQENALKRASESYEKTFQVVGSARKKQPAWKTSASRYNNNPSSTHHRQSSKYYWFLSILVTVVAVIYTAMTRDTVVNHYVTSTLRHFEHKLKDFSASSAEDNTESMSYSDNDEILLSSTQWDRLQQ